MKAVDASRKFRVIRVASELGVVLIRKIERKKNIIHMIQK